RSSHVDLAARPSFSMVRCPPTSSLFPYTTLFRSITEELNFFEEYTIISLTPPKVEGNPSIIEAIDDKENEAILLLDNKAILIIYNFKKENQFGFIYDLRK